MKRYPILIVLIIISILNLSCKKNDQHSPQIISPPSQGIIDTTDILFIGASYFLGNNLTDLFDSISKNENFTTNIENFSVPGAFLEYHANNQASLNKINEKNWDFVILQGVGSNVAYPDGYPNDPVDVPPLFPSIEILVNHIKANYQRTTVLFCMPWAFEDGMTWVPEGTDTYEVMQQKIYDNSLALRSLLHIGIAPVGWAYNAIMSESPPLHYLFMSDYNHPSEKGTYLMACVLYACIFQDSPTNISFTGKVDNKEATYFQYIADTLLFNNFEHWNIPSINR